MFTTIRKRITYTNVLLTLALVFAMTGGAYAARHYLITSTAQISPKVLKELQGMAGRSGATGPQGPPGTAGLQGPAGPRGEAGTAGTAGKNGKNGKEGAEGEPGKEGSPWTAGGTLPSGAGETGTWSMQPLGKEVSSVFQIFIPISFSIPLKTSIEEANIHVFEGAGAPPSGCTGTVVSEAFLTDLKAEPGNLCIYLRGGFGLSANQLFPLSPESALELPEAKGAGVVLTNIAAFPEGAYAFGTWAVTEK